MVDLYDGDGYRWDVYETTGSVVDGDNDTFDNGLVLYIDGNYFSGTSTFELGGRQLVVTGTNGLEGGGFEDLRAAAIGTLAVERRVYVPDGDGEGWARYLETFTNTSAATQTFNVRLYSNSGNDNGFTIVSTSSGDATLTTADTWYINDDYGYDYPDGQGDPALLNVFGDGTLLPTAVEGTNGRGYDGFTFTLTLQPGQTRSILHYHSQHYFNSGNLAELPGLVNPSAAALFGLTQAQLASVANYALVAAPPAPPVSPIPVSVASTSVTEGDSGSVAGAFVLTRSITGRETTVTFEIAPGTATAGVDYSAPTTGSVTFAAGATTARVPFQILGDRLLEGDETFTLTITSVSNGYAVGGPATATIVENDIYANAQYGSSSDDVLIAQVTGATLVGLGGNDTYLVHNLGDQVIEERGGGVDIVYTDVSYNLGANEVEALSVADQRGTAAIDLTGNYLSQTIVGNYGDNVLNGGSGADTLIGLFGNDIYAVADSRIVIIEDAGQGSDTVSALVDYTLGAGVSVEALVAQDRGSTTGIRLTGNEVSQTIVGTAGADTLSGGGGTDVLIGGAGADVFVLGTGGVAGLADFQSSTDRIALGQGLNVGTALDASEFLVGTAATTAEQRVVFNQQTGQLFYDADGNGAGAAVLIGLVQPGTQLSVSDFTVVPNLAAA